MVVVSNFANWLQQQLDPQLHQHTATLKHLAAVSLFLFL